MLGDQGVDQTGLPSLARGREHDLLLDLEVAAKLQLPQIERLLAQALELGKACGAGVIAQAPLDHHAQRQAVVVLAGQRHQSRVALHSLSLSVVGDLLGLVPTNSPEVEEEHPKEHHQHDWQ